MLQTPVFARVALACLLALLTAGPLGGCSNAPKLRIVTDPPGARVVVMNEATGRTVRVARNQRIQGSSTFRADFGKTGLVTYRLTAIPPAEAIRSHRETTIVLDRDLFRLQPIGTDRTKEMLVRLDGGQRPPPVDMTIRFKSVRVIFPADQAGRAAGPAVSNEWDDLVAGIEAEVRTGGSLRALEQLLAQMKEIGIPDQRYLSDERNDELTSDGQLIRFYDVPLIIRLENLAPINDLAEKIARIGGGTGRGGVVVPEFMPVSAEINYQTTFVNSRVTITVSGIAPLGARVFLYGTDFDEPVEVQRQGTTTEWSQTVRVRPRQRYIYGFSFERVGATNLRKAFRIDIFSQRTEEIPVASFERLRRDEP
ncbi:MAG: hypothetical protein AAGB51_13700 [Planctomycetota bacterium]